MISYDGKLLVVGNFKKIISILDNEIVFDFKRFNLLVKGDGLKIPYLEDNEVGVSGVIKDISFFYKMVKNND